MKHTIVTGLLPVVFIAAACSDTTSPRASGLAAPTAGATVRIAGAGTILTPDGVTISFDFDVGDDRTGRFTASDSSDVRPDGSVGTLRVDASDAGTSFNTFRTTSSTCSDPNNGVEFDGTGREDTGGLVAFTVMACDNGPSGSGLDVFRIQIPSESYDRSGPVNRGDISKSAATTAGGTIVVSTSTSGSNVPGGYTVTLDGTASQAIAANGTVTWSGLAAGSHSIQLSSDAQNCTVESANPQTVSLPDGGTASVQFDVSCTSSNQPPVVNAGPNETVLLGLLYTEHVTFSDPDNDGPWTYTIDWGDGSSPTSGSASAQGSIDAGHSYILPLGTHTITATVTDAHSASGSGSKVVTVIL